MLLHRNKFTLTKSAGYVEWNHIAVHHSTFGIQAKQDPCISSGSITLQETTMYKVSEQISKTNKAGVETFMTIANTTFAGAERLAALNLNAARNFIEDSAANTRALLAVKDLEALVSLQKSLAQPDSGKATDYTRRVYEIATQTQEALSQVVEAQVSELNKNLGLALDEAVKTAPAGSDLAVNALRSAISAANSAYDSMSKAAKQATEIAEANLAAATSAVTQKKAARKAA
jgi:phasin family protein